MRLITLVILVLFVIPQPTYSAEDLLDLAPRWKQGEKVRYERVRRDSELRNGKSTSDNGVRHEVEIEIVKAAKEGYLVGWKVGRVEFEDAEASKRPRLRQRPACLRTSRFSCKLTRTAGFGVCKTTRS